MPNRFSNKAILQELEAFLKKKIRFKQSILGWPDFDENLKMPAISIHFSNDGSFAPHFSRKISVLSNDPISDILYKVGDHNFSIQMDIFNSSKEERWVYQRKIFEAFHSQNSELTSCLHLKVDNWLDQIASYHLGTISSVDGPIEITRSEFRSICQVEVDVGAFMIGENHPVIKESSIAEIEISEYVNIP